MHREHVHKVSVRRHKSHQQPESNNSSPNKWDHVMRLRLYTPPIPKQADGHEESANAHCVKAVLGLEVSTCYVLCGSRVAEMRENELTHQRTYAEAEEREANYTSVPTILIGEDSREGCKEYVKVGVSDGDVEGYHEANQRPCEHLGRTNNGEEEQVARRKAAVEFGP